MANSKHKKSINVNKETVERFEYLYPRLKELFVDRALKLALQDKRYFEDVLFNPLFMEIK